MADILHLIPEFLFNAEILGNHDTDIKILLIKTLGQRTHNICQTPCLDKGNRF